MRALISYIRRSRECCELNMHISDRILTKRESYIDPTLPTYIRIPSEPLPRSWSHIIKPMESTEQKELHCR